MECGRKDGRKQIWHKQESQVDVKQQHHVDNTYPWISYSVQQLKRQSISFVNVFQNEQYEHNQK